MKTVRSRDKDGNFHDVPVGEIVFRPSAYGVIIADEKILLSRQWDGYDFPGGGMEISETIRETVEREVWEETGMEIRAGEIITCESAFFSFIHEETTQKFHANSILMYCLCEVIGGQLSVDNLDDDEKRYASLAEWVPISDIRTIKFYNSVDSVKIIEMALNRLTNVQSV